MNKISSAKPLLKILVLLGYLTIFFWLINAWSDWVWFVVGVACGVILLVADEQVLHRWYREPGEQLFLVTRSPLFLASIVPLMIFVQTSSNSYWASGLVGAMGLVLLTEMMELRKQPGLFFQRFLQGVKSDPSPDTANSITWIGLGVFLLVHLLAIL